MKPMSLNEAKASPIQEHYTAYHSAYTGMVMPTFNNDIDQQADYDNMFEQAHKSAQLVKQRESGSDNITISMTHASDADSGA